MTAPSGGADRAAAETDATSALLRRVDFILMRCTELKIKAVVLTIHTKVILARYKIIPRNDHPINAARRAYMHTWWILGPILAPERG